MAQSDALPATAAWQADDMMAVASMDLDMLPDLQDFDASLSELSQSGWSIQQDVRQPGEPLDLLNLPSRGLNQDLHDLNWLQELPSSPSLPSDAPPSLFLPHRPHDATPHSTAWQSSFPAAATSHNREPPRGARLQPSFPSSTARLALRPQDISGPSEAQQPSFPTAATSLSFQPPPITSPVQAERSLSKHLSLRLQSPSPASTLRATTSLPQPTQADGTVLRSRVLPMDAVLDHVREETLGTQEASIADPSQQDLTRSALPTASQISGNPPAFIIRGGLQAAAQAAAELARSQASQDPLSQAGGAPLLRYGRKIDLSGKVREEGATGRSPGPDVGGNLGGKARRESRPKSPECDSKESQSSLPGERPGERRKRSRELLEPVQSAETDQPSRRPTSPLKSRMTFSGDNSYRIISGNYPRSFSAPDVTRGLQQKPPSPADEAAQATGSGSREEADRGICSAPAEIAMLVQPDKLLRFAEQLESIREKALLLQSEKEAVAKQAAQWQRRESHMAELVASLEQLSEEGAPVDAREELLKRGVAELSQMVLEQAPSKDQPEEGTSRGHSDAGPSS